MASLAIPSFRSATILAQHHTAAAVAEVAPWRGILAVEPDVAVLRAKSLILTQASYCVTPATSDREVFSLRATKAFALAILSDHLGPRLLASIAETVRRHWSRTRILILGEVPITFADYLYDEHIHRSADPQRVLDDLESLYRGMWNQRSKSIDWNASRSAVCFSRRLIAESDRTKAGPPAPTEDRTPRDMPMDIRIPVTRATRTGEPLVVGPTPSETTILAPCNERPS